MRYVHHVPGTQLLAQLHAPKAYQYQFSMSTPPAVATLHVAVGSSNRVKVSAVQRAFSRVYPACTVLTHSVPAASGVSDQPMGDDETRRGAVNRASAAADAYRSSSGRDADFAVGLEGGCEDVTLHLPGVPATCVDMTCFAWMAVLAPSTGAWGVSRTGSFVLPPPVARLVRGGLELGAADDVVFKRTDSKASDGAVGLLTQGVIDRAAYYEHALILALVPHVSSCYYEAT